VTSTAASVATFDICGDLPTGTTLLEASAGTGKTFTIAALATRYVAEGIAELGELMLVTFGRAATQELRERVRERLVSMQRALRDPGTARASADMLEASLAGVSDDEVAVRRARLTRALADFDAATIATTHGFCQQMLTGLGVAGDLEPDATFAESVDDLVVEVVDDLYLRKFGRPDSPRAPVLTYADALSTVRRAVYDPQAVLAPDDAEAGTLAALRFGIARRARQEVALRKRQRRLLDYDDLVLRLRDALVDNPAAQQRVRSRYRIVMVDEFQDTDPAQWEILRLAFHGHTTLVLIADPKQAIYAFRGGDVDAYLAAAEVATARATLGRNWRSDAALLDALNAVFGGAALGQEQIVVRPVDSAHPHRRLAGTPSDAPLRLRVVRRTQLDQGRGKLPRVDPARELVAADVAADVVRLLEAGAMLHTLGPPRAVTAGDVAVLVRTNAQALLLRDAFRQVAVPAVLTGAVNVFTTDMAIEWLVLLQALEQPHRAVRVRTAAIGRFVGWSAERLAQAGDDAMDELGPLLRSWADVLATRGVPALLEVITELGLPERLLRTVDGERQLTDLRHLAQSLHAASVAENLGVAAQVEWLQRRIADAGDDPTEERSRRLESDAAAVQIVTVHRSKGLEFPVVYAPFAWDTYKGNPEFLRLHLDGARILDVSGKDGPSYGENRPLMRRGGRRGSAAAVRRVDQGAMPGGDLVGADHDDGCLPVAAAADELVRSRGAASSQGRRARRRRGRHRVQPPGRTLAGRGLGRSGARRQGPPLDTAAARHSGLERGAFRPRARRRLAAHLLHRSHLRRLPRGSRSEQRAGRAAARRRGRRRPADRCRPARRTAAGGDLADGRAAGGDGVRHRRPLRPGGRRHRRPRHPGGAHRAVPRGARRAADPGHGPGRAGDRAPAVVAHAARSVDGAAATDRRAPRRPVGRAGLRVAPRRRGPSGCTCGPAALGGRAVAQTAAAR
jgi:superfamily I DNA/RNA helicase